MANIRSDIIKGPSKFDLMIALFDKDINKPSHIVEFKLANGTSANIIVNGVEAQSGSGRWWIFRGFVQKTGSQRSRPVPPTKCWGEYYTDTRDGWIEIIRD